MAELIAQGVEAELERLAPSGAELVGLSCLADGADQIFATAVLNRGGHIEVIVPAEKYRDGLPEDAKAQYDNLLSRATAVHSRTHVESTSEAHMDASRFMVDSADHLIAVWDGEPARAYGGTADVVQYAQDKRLPVSVVWPVGARRD
ncbi:hypothetical protein [Plantactinospora mayteni]|uniref:hypothetical protein n=1 Tax=Plantactinospora mayteni TaxID=566021 RepID=UPI001EF5A3A5|nr:hypothetical protein [Plantactinospora mayteni]